MPVPCCLGPLQTLGADEHGRETRVGLRAARCIPAGTPQHEQPGCHGQQVDGSRRQTDSWVERGRSLVKPHVEVRDSLKLEGWAASSMDQSKNLWCFFWACPRPPMDQSAHAFFPLKPIKTLDSARPGQISEQPACRDKLPTVGLPSAES